VRRIWFNEKAVIYSERYDYLNGLYLLFEILIKISKVFSLIVTIFLINFAIILKIIDLCLGCTHPVSVVHSLTLILRGCNETNKCKVHPRTGQKVTEGE
jgi:hypothetical protein